MSGPDEMDEALNDGFDALAVWEAAEQRVETASTDATEAMREAMKRTSLSLRQIAARTKLSPAALSQVANHHLDNLSSTATRRVLMVIRQHEATPQG